MWDCHGRNRSRAYLGSVYTFFSVTIVQNIFETPLEFAFSLYSTRILIIYLNILILINFCSEGELEFQPRLARGSLVKVVGRKLYCGTVFNSELRLAL